MENKVNPIKTTAIAGTIGAGASAAANIAVQKSILSRPDEYLTQLKGRIESDRKFNTSFHKGTQEAADLANKKLDECLKKAQQYIAKGKINFSSVAKYAAIGGAIVAGITGLMAQSAKSHKEELREDARIVADEFKKTQIDENK